MSRRWNRLVNRLRKRHGDLQVFVAREVQRRGALHLHVMIRSASGAPLVLTKREVRQLAIRHGFGHEVDVQPLAPGHAAYVAKYVSKSAGERQTVPWRGHKLRQVVDESTGEVRRIRVPSSCPSYRTWTASRRWGESMAAVLAAQSHWLVIVAGLPSWLDHEPRPWWCEGLPSRPCSRTATGPPVPVA